MSRPKCKCCGKTIAKDTKLVSAPRVKEGGWWPVKDWEYRGNMRITKRNFQKVPIAFDEETGLATEYEKRLSGVYVWDGESYLTRNGYFCTYVCAANFGEGCARMIAAGELKVVRK